MLRKSAVTVAIAGAGLASMSGAAFANTSHHGDDSHGKHSYQHNGSCTNVVKQSQKTEGRGPIDVLGGDNGAIPVNVCDVANDNHLLNGISVGIGDTGFTLPGGELPEFPDFGGSGELPTFPTV
ncbi:hypothetical protein [Actinomycetospora sp. TBRC 11914]|uniref:hypothetical protein n=1 Tax=Actinomycetospora sp. TBRC 11914 TaxID=2729387 RepID=UPI00145CABC7|nr:hypothetical protein [Actinomycetospora sp. TBRC 11914]NMO92574.1 hypothetical protein [Actinomycetospora sp. TBRC 11914]